MNYIKQNHLSLLIILWLVFGGMFVDKSVSLGGAGTADDIHLTGDVMIDTYAGKTGTLKIGSNGGTVNELKSTTCTLSTTQLPLEATSTDVFYCAITGVASGDQVFVSLPSDNSQVDLSTGGGTGFLVTYAKASSTAGYIEVGLGNLSGAATSTFPLATTSVQVLYIDN